MFKKKTNVRSLKELYTLVLNYLEGKEKEEWYYIGICSAITRLNYNQTITNNEWTILRTHFKKQKPCEGYLFGIFSKHKEFTNDISFIDDVFWWTQDAEGLQQRIKFIKYLITKV
jgi:hypothetical protein